MENPALFATPNCSLFVANAPILEPKSDELRVHVRASGVCGSDLTLWKSGGIAHLKIEHPYIIGHESAGEVVAVGSNVIGFDIGDRVAIEPGINCGDCYACSRGFSNCCQKVKFSGVIHETGSIQRFKCHPAKFCHKMPSNLSYSQGALLEPLSVVMSAFRRVTVKLGSSTLICGAGPIGLIAMLHARSSGASRVVISDIDAHRLSYAKKICPLVETFQVLPDQTPNECAQHIRQLFGGDDPTRLPQVTIECSGVQSSLQTAIFSTGTRGTVVVIGVGKSEISIPSGWLLLHEIDLKFSNRYCDTWPAAIAVLSSGNLNLDALVSHRFPLEQAVQAMETFGDKYSKSIKVQIVDE